MLMHWLAVSVFLADSGHLQTVWGTVFVAPPCRVKAHRDAELTLGCGDETIGGVVLYWHTPFGQVQRAHSLQDPVFMQHDGSLVVSNTSEFHNGLYYCLKQRTEGTAVWWYQLRIGPDLHRAYRQEGHCGGLRVRRGLRGPESEQGELSVTEEVLVGAVVASVLLTFVVGFSAGALSRTHVLRCIRAVGSGCNPQHHRTDPLDPHPEVPLSTLRPESTGHPAKPRRSLKRNEEPHSTAYLETCDYSGEEENQKNLSSEEVRGAEDVLDAEDLRGAQEGKGAEKVRGTEEVIGTEDVSCIEDVGDTEYVRGAEEERAVEHASGADVSEVSCAEEVSGVEEVKGAEDVSDAEVVSKVSGAEEVMGAEGEKIIERLTEEEKSVEVVRARGTEHLREKERGAEENGKEEERDPEEENGKEEERGAEEENGGKEEERGAEDDQFDSSADTEGVEEQGGTEEGEEHAQPGDARRPRVRVIRLYQYNEDGERYCHLPGPSPQEPGPLPSLKQRSLSLTRLRAIMATASAGPLEIPEDHRETEQEEDKAHFCMESSS